MKKICDGVEPQALRIRTSVSAVYDGAGARQLDVARAQAVDAVHRQCRHREPVER